MDKLQYDNGDFLFFKGGSVLPYVVVDNDNKKILEVIICDSISGGANMKENMPKRLSLIRRCENGNEYRGTYYLSEE